MDSFTEHIFKNFLNLKLQCPEDKTVCLAVSTMLISLRYTKIKFQERKAFNYISQQALLWLNEI